MRTKALAIGFSLAALAGQPGTAARPTKARHEHSPAPARQPGPPPPMDPAFTARLFQIRVCRIQQCIGLSEERARVVAERWGRWDREHIDRGQKAAELRKQFNQILMGPEREEDKNNRLKPYMDQFLALRMQQDLGRKQFEEDIRTGLSIAQQARLILVMEEIQQWLREGLQDMKAKGK